MKKIAYANIQPLTIRELLYSIKLITELILTIITAVFYYLPHFLLQGLLEYLERDPLREHRGWGWLLSLGLFVSNAGVYIVSGIIWSISTTTLQARIKLQLQTLLFSKTLRKKDVASSANATEGADDEKKEDDEDVTSKSQIMVR